MREETPLTYAFDTFWRWANKDIEDPFSGQELQQGASRASRIAASVFFSLSKDPK